MTRDPAAAWPAVTTLVVPHLIAVSLAGDTWLFGDDWRDAPQTAFRIEPGPSGGTLGCALYLHGPTLRAPSQPPGPPRRPSGRFGEVVLTGAAAGTAFGPRAGQVFMAQMLKVAFSPADYDTWALHDLAALAEAAGRVAGRLAVGPVEARAVSSGFGVNATCLARPIRRWAGPGPCKRVGRVAAEDRLWWVFHRLADRVSLATGDLMTVCG